MNKMANHRRAYFAAIVILFAGCAKTNTLLSTFKQTGYNNTAPVLNSSYKYEGTNLTISFSQRYIQKSSTLERVSFHLFPFVFFNYWDFNYVYTIGENRLPAQFPFLFRNRLLTDINQAIPNSLTNCPLKIDLKINRMLVLGKYKRWNALGLLFYMGLMKEESVGFESNIEAHIRVENNGQNILDRDINVRKIKQGKELKNDKEMTRKEFPSDVYDNLDASIKELNTMIIRELNLLDTCKI